MAACLSHNRAEWLKSAGPSATAGQQVVDGFNLAVELNGAARATQNTSIFDLSRFQTVTVT